MGANRINRILFLGLGIVAAASAVLEQSGRMERVRRGTADSPTALVPEAPRFFMGEIMDKLNVLTWEKVSFKEKWPEREAEGYIFKIDGTPVTNYIGWMQPVYARDIYYSKFLESSEKYDEEYDPVLACCTCGISECDSIRAYVTVKKDTVTWLIFNANGSFNREENLEERSYEDYEFDRIQYEATIKELMLQAEKEFLNRRK